MSGDDSHQVLSVQQQAVDLLLRAIYWKAPDGLLHSFMYGRPGDRFGQCRMGVEIHYTRKGLLNAALYLRKQGPKHIKGLPIGRVEDFLKRFVEQNFWTISEEVFGATFSCSFGEYVSPRVKAILAQAMAASEIFNAAEYLTLYPLSTIRVESDFDSNAFFMVAPPHLTERLPERLRPHLAKVDQFPPMTKFDGRREFASAWIGVRASTEDASRKVMSAVLGAVALTPHRYERYLFTGREVFGGSLRINPDSSVTYAFGDAHTPPISEDIVLSNGDEPWLRLLSEKLSSDIKSDKRQLKALEYYYRAWGTKDVERFPILFMALDAIFGDASAATQAVVNAISPIMGPDYSYDRLKRLLSLRASVVHGGAPDICESDNYHIYHADYGENPIRDLELIVARCFQSEIFRGFLKERPHTYADLMRKRTGHIIE